MIQIVKAVNLGTACPTQWDAWDSEGWQYYVRYRYGRLRIDAVDDVNENVTLLSRQLGDGLDGILGFSELKEATAAGFLWPQYEEWGEM